MVGGGERPLAIYVAKDHVLVVCVGVFHAEAKECDGSCARAMRPKSLLLGVEVILLSM